MQIGILYAATAYIMWGLFPLYFKSLQNVAPVQILWHRVVWAFVLLLIVLAVRRQWSWISRVSRQPQVMAGFAASAALLSINWFIYIWSVNNDHVVDASLQAGHPPWIGLSLALSFGFYGLLRKTAALGAFRWPPWDCCSI